MQVRLVAAGALVAAAVVSACGGTDAPTGPSNPAVPSPPAVSSVAVTSSTTSFITRGQTQQLAAMATLTNGFVENRSATATWASDNTGVATVSSSGMLTVGNEGAGDDFGHCRRAARDATSPRAVRLPDS